MPNFLKKHWKKVLVLCAALLVGFLLYRQFFASQSQNLESAKVKRGTLEETLTISGQVNADQKADLQFQTGGQLAWVGIKVGDHVEKYQVIASLDQRQLRKTLDKYLQAYKKDRNAFDQTKDTYKDKVITDEIKRTIESSQADLNSSVLDVEIQDLTVKFSNLWTPIDGVVTRIDTPLVGTNITVPSQAIFAVVNPSSIYFSANADQTEVTKLHPGASAQLTLDSYPEQTVGGTVQDLSFTPVQGESGTSYEVKFTFPADNSGHQYKLGMTGDLTFTTAKKDNVLFVPIKFVKSEAGKRYVMVKDGDKTKKAYVTLGLETDNNVEIKSGLKEGQTIISIK